MNLKHVLVSVLATLTLSSALADMVTLRSEATIRTQNRRDGILREFITVPAGTVVEFARRERLGLPAGTEYFDSNFNVRYSSKRWVRIKNIELTRRAIQNVPAYDVKNLRDDVQYVNDTLSKNRQEDRDGYTPYYVSAGSVGADYRPAPTTTTTTTTVIDAPVHGGHTTTVTTHGNTQSYEQCYTQVKSRWQRRMDDASRRQREEARGQQIFGAILGIAGAAIANNADNDAGRIIGTGAAIIGGVLVIDGAVKVNQTFDIINYNNTRCDTFYRKVERRRTVVHNRTCDVYKYESHNYSSSAYYYETRCGTSTYVSFDESYGPWRRGSTVQYY